MKTVNEKMHDIIDINFDEQLAATQEILKIKTVLDESRASDEHPFGPDATRGLTDFLSRAEKLGFRVKNIDNYAGFAEIGEGEGLVGILAHLDVVPEGRESDWKHHPYGAVIDGGELWGRGSIDDKGPAMASLYAMKALRDSGVPLKRRFRLILGLDEESGSRCITHYNKFEEEPEFSFSPDAEFPVVNAEKGILRATITITVRNAGKPEGSYLAELQGGDRFNVVPDEASALIKCTPAKTEEIIGCCTDLETQITADGLKVIAKGVSAHAMEPSKGVNAVQKLLLALKSARLTEPDDKLADSLFRLTGSGFSGDELGIASSDEVSGALTCNVAAVSLEICGDVKSARLKLDIRYPVTADSEMIIGKLEFSVKDAGGALLVNANKKPLYVPQSSRVVQTLLDAYETVTGDRPKPVSMGGGTYCRFMPNAVSAGPLFPGQEELAHQANERVSVEDLRKSTHIYAEALARFND